MSQRRDSRPGAVVDWAAGERRRGDLKAELERITRALPPLGVKRALLFGSLARGEVRGQSDLDLILIVDTGDPFVDRCARFYASREPRIGMDRLVYTPAEFEAMRDRPFLRQSLRDAMGSYEA